MNETERWEEAAREAFDQFLQELKEDLPKGSNFEQIEEAIFLRQRTLLSQVLQARVNAEGDFSPQAS